jgi:hypothetical protein
MVIPNREYEIHCRQLLLVNTRNFKYSGQELQT